VDNNRKRENLPRDEISEKTNELEEKGSWPSKRGVVVPKRRGVITVWASLQNEAANGV